MSEYRSEHVIERHARPRSSRRAALAVVIVSFLLAAIIGMTSNDSPWVGGDGGRSSPPAFVGEVVAVALAAGLCVLAGLVWVRAPRRGKPTKRPGSPANPTEELGSRVRAGTLVLVAGTAALIALVLAFWFLLGQAGDVAPPPVVATTAGEAVALPAKEPAPSASPVFDWFLVAFVGSLAVILPLALLARRRFRPPEDVEAVGDVPESVVRAVGESIDQIGRDPDPRRAIIRAYAQMENAFDEAGVPRRPAEAPFEYLGRALRGVRVSRPAAGHLASLFERARFSQHAVGAETKDDAIEALREIERQIQEPPP